MAIVRITRKFRFEMAHALLNYNGLTMGSLLRAGDILKIPQKCEATC